MRTHTYPHALTDPVKQINLSVKTLQRSNRQEITMVRVYKVLLKIEFTVGFPQVREKMWPGDKSVAATLISIVYSKINM